MIEIESYLLLSSPMQLCMFGDNNRNVSGNAHYCNKAMFNIQKSNMALESFFCGTFAPMTSKANLDEESVKRKTYHELRKIGQRIESTKY